MTDFKCKTDEELRVEQRQRALDWERAVGKLDITFTAAHGGGWPDRLIQVGITPELRLHYLRSLSFRVRERYELDVGTTATPEVHQYCRLCGGLVVDLTDGWVGQEAVQ